MTIRIRFYIARRGDEIMIANCDQNGAIMLTGQGWELANRPVDTREEAEEIRRQWTENGFPPK